MKKDAAPGDRLISGKLRAKAGRAGAARTTVTVDGMEYVWAYRHGWIVQGKGLRVLSLSVSLQPGRTRELILDVTMKLDIEDAPPTETRVLRALDEGIRAARSEGWNPASRGRARRYAIDAE
jgi:hypothetical protein